jgi:hypothetical protein
MKEQSNRLKAEYDKLNDKGKRFIREKLMKRCLWSESTFHRKLNDPEQISPVEQDEVARVIGRRRYVLFPKRLEVAA